MAASPVIILPIKDSADNGTLAAATATTGYGNQYTNLSEPFLMTHIDVGITMTGGTVNEQVLVGLVHGEASATDIKEAVERTVIPHQPTDQASIRNIIWKFGVYQMQARSGGDAQAFIRVTKSFGKGLPFKGEEAGEAGGFAFFVYNLETSALTTGMQLSVNGYAAGVWL